MEEISDLGDVRRLLKICLPFMFLDGRTNTIVLKSEIGGLAKPDVLEATLLVF